ncbi:MAG: crotonase/enoyl-CoA hydratase family protein [Polyangiaceae bacterium]
MNVRVERDDAVVTILITRPEARNAIDRATADELAQAFRDFESDETLRVAVLAGEGSTFCAGADLKAIARGEPNRVDPEGDAPLGPTRMVLKKPAIAAIEGFAVAGGLELALFCDLRVAAASAQLGVFCRRWGVPLIDGGTVRLPRVVGLGRALDLILTGRAVDSTEALAMGLVNRVVPDGTAIACAQRLAREIGALPQTCMLNDRASAFESFDLEFEAAMKNELRHGLESLAAGSIEGAARFAGGAGRSGS